MVGVRRVELRSQPYQGCILYRWTIRHRALQQDSIPASPAPSPLRGDQGQCVPYTTELHGGATTVPLARFATRTRLSDLPRSLDLSRTASRDSVRCAYEGLNLGPPPCQGGTLATELQALVWASSESNAALRGFSPVCLPEVTSGPCGETYACSERIGERSC